ncbi:MAG: hypothetical protein L0Y72_21165 [Gemmataceae bacterium]|nr:hypothetical protein [Gemmataceae bacterium]MCI0741553.1 hypothetical protein [Gemmataceae bacterium]
MICIRLAKAEWGKAWRVMIEIAPVRLIAEDPVYEVLPAHLDLLKANGIAYHLVNQRKSQKDKRHGTSH